MKEQTGTFLWIVMGALFVAILLAGCDTIVNPTPIEVIVEATPVTVINEDEILITNKYDGRWLGQGWENENVSHYIRWSIGPMAEDGRRSIGGDVLITDKTRDFTQSFPVQATYLTYTGNQWHAIMYISSVWSIRGRLVDPDTMEITIDHFIPRGQTFILTRADDTFPKQSQ